MVSLLNPELYGEQIPAFVFDYIKLLEDSVTEADSMLRGMPGAKGAFSGSLVVLERFVSGIENAEEGEQENEGETPYLQEEPLESFLYPDDE